MGEISIRDRFSKIIGDLERITDLNSRRGPGWKELSLSDVSGKPRAELGDSVSMEYFRMIRLLAFNELFGGAASRSVYAAGEKVGKSLGIRSLAELREKIASMGLAKAEIEAPDADEPSRLTIRFRESAVSAGVPIMGGPICHFECGLLAGALSTVFDKKIRVTETKCVAMGYDYCQFDAEPADKGRARRGADAVPDALEGSDYSDENVQLLTTLAAHAVTALENALLYENTKKMVITDSLTSTYNYGYLQTRLKEEVQRSERQNLCFAMVMIDVDEFKVINDQFGHLAGDNALREIALIMKENIRAIDMLCRYGGDEFALILPQTDKKETMVVLERIRREIERHDFGRVLGEGAQLLKVTASFGCALYPGDSRFSEQLLTQADQALYEAKRAGKNKTCFFSDGKAVDR